MTTSYMKQAIKATTYRVPGFQKHFAAVLKRASRQNLNILLHLNLHPAYYRGGALMMMRSFTHTLTLTNI